jgi:hypothetical protein
VALPAWPALITAIGQLCSAARRSSAPWYVEAHQFRIDTTDGIGRPTPEGAHRDGVDFVAVLLVGEGIKGGETRVFEADGPNGKRFTMTAPWTLLLLDDALSSTNPRRSSRCSARPPRHAGADLAQQRFPGPALKSGSQRSRGLIFANLARTTA